MASKLWPDAVVKLAPPVQARPRCYACGKRLKPLYRNEPETRVYDDKTRKWRVSRNSEIHSTNQYLDTRLAERVWIGKYGFESMFCSINCASVWATVHAADQSAHGTEPFLLEAQRFIEADGDKEDE